MPIEVNGLSKQYGAVAAVRDVHFTAHPGRVTGFLGPNGAGKSTTLRMILGLVRPDSGSATVGGSPFRDLPTPTRIVGATLDLAAAHPAMTARTQLRIQSDLGGHPRDRIDDVLTITGLHRAADRRTRGFSTGMHRRLALATALLGDPAVLILDEPSAGLDPAGVAWLRQLVVDHAAAGGTVLISSHQLAELELSIDDLVVINDGQIVWSGSRPDFVDGHPDLETAFLTRTMTTEAAR
ncbi:ABC transporter ATP-binding protein [Microlunatus soli]|nr:ATP-binding cassette domain-containing protein [Microlunatus soli]